MRLQVLVLVVFFLIGCSNPVRFYMPQADKTVGYVEVFDSRALSLLNNNTKISIRGSGFSWTEGPVWVSEGSYLLFTDIPQNLIRKYEVHKGDSIYLKNSGFSSPPDNGLVRKGPGANGLLLNANDELILMQTGGRQIARMNADLSYPKAKYFPLAHTYKGMRLNGTNDGVYHSDGSLYFTDPKIGLDLVINEEGKYVPSKASSVVINNLTARKQETPFAGIYRLSEQGELSLLDESVSVPNGITLSPDEKVLYVSVSDKNNPLWLAYDINRDNTLKNKRTFYDANHLLGKEGEQGLPDGMAVHSSGIIFATGPGGVWLFDEEAKVLAKIRTGELTSNCTLTSDENYLFITADDFLMSVPLFVN